MEPGFDGVGFGVAETVLELVGSLFYLEIYMFDAVAIPMCFVWNRSPWWERESFEPRHDIDENERITHALVLTNLRHEHLEVCGGARRIQSNVSQAVGRAVDGGEHHSHWSSS